MILVEGDTAYDTDFAMFYTLYHIFKQESIQGIHYIIYFNHAFDNTYFMKILNFFEFLNIFF
jgi:hypothetical protein